MQLPFWIQCQYGRPLFCCSPSTTFIALSPLRRAKSSLFTSGNDEHILSLADFETGVVMSLVDLGKRLLESAKLGETEEVRNLMTSGAPFTTDWLGTSPLHLAAQYGHVGTAEVLIRAGISRDARTKVDRTALHVAAQEGHVDIVNLLIKNGADIEAKDMLKMTPLHWAVEKSHVAVVELLLQNGADVNSLSKFEKSPVSIALDNGRLDVVHILQSSHRYRDPSLEVTIESNDSGDKDSKDGLVISDVVPHEDIRSIQSNLSSKSVPMKPIILRTNHSNAKSGSKSEVEEDANDQSSTSVLATLAALAETMGPINAGNNPSAAEALQWLESHGLTVLSQDNIITSVLESGQTLTLTEAGKLALNWSKRGKRCSDKMQDNLESTFGNLKNPANQKVIAFVTDNAQHAAGGVGNAGQIVVAMSNLVDRVNSVSTDAGTTVVEPALKRPKSENCTPDSIDDFAQLDRDQLARRLEEVQRKARDFEEQLRMKEHEAEEYKRKLESMSQQRTNTK